MTPSKLTLAKTPDVGARLNAERGLVVAAELNRLGCAVCATCAAEVWRITTPEGWAEPSILVEEHPRGPWMFDDEFSGDRVGKTLGEFRIHRCDREEAVGDA